MFVLRSRPAQAQRKKRMYKTSVLVVWGSNMAKVQAKPLSTVAAKGRAAAATRHQLAAMMTMRDEGIVSTALTDTLRRRQMYSR